jgi:hypothetical protein
MIPGQPFETFFITSLPTGNSSCVIVSCTLAIRPTDSPSFPISKVTRDGASDPIGERVAEHARRLALQDLPAPPRLTLRTVALDLGTDTQIGFIAPCQGLDQMRPPR